MTIAQATALLLLTALAQAQTPPTGSPEAAQPTQSIEVFNGPKK